MLSITPAKHTSRKDLILQYIIVAVGLFIFTSGWSLFLVPSKIVGSGTSGISTIVFLITEFPIGYTNFILNAILVLIGIKVLGPRFGFNTVYGIAITSLWYVVQQQLLGWNTHPMILETVNELGPLLCSILGGVLSGVGIAIAIANGSNSGGTDIIALIITKYHNISPGKVILACDLFIIASSIFTPEGSLSKIIYGYIMMIGFTTTLDLILEGNKQSFQILIFSPKNEEIAKIITEQVGRGATLLHGEGCYTHKETKVLVAIVHRGDKSKVMKSVKKIDPQAFLAVSKVQGVFGRNFDTIKD